LRAFERRWSIHILFLHLNKILTFDQVFSLIQNLERIMGLIGLVNWEMGMVISHSTEPLNWRRFNHNINALWILKENVWEFKLFVKNNLIR